MNDITLGTPKVLKEYLDLISSPSHESYVELRENTPVDKYVYHPDIQYFKRIKSKNHYNYHKIKNMNNNSTQMVTAKKQTFDPFNRNNLLIRLSTFNALNWHLPLETADSEVNELLCARNGWKCVSISVNNNTKNHLKCTSCTGELFLKFNDESSPSSFVPFEFDLEDYQELNKSLMCQYSIQIEKEGHDKNCPWTNFETPLDGIYYPRPYINSTNELLIGDYLKNLKNLAENASVLINNCCNFKESFLQEDVDAKFKDFISISNNWLLNRFYKDEKENYSSILMNLPPWLYKIAVLGWNLNIQSFSNQLVLLLICSKCNKRVFLNTAYHEPIDKTTTDTISKIGMNLSTSRILTPCEHPPLMTGMSVLDDSIYSESGPGDLDFENDTGFDLIEEHKPWCCVVKPVNEAISLYHYFIEMATTSENIRSDGKFNHNSEIDANNILSSAQKRRKSFDINEGLERFHKLRKLYLLEDSK